MQRDPSEYADAARLLWDVPPDRLEAMASGRLQTSQSVRDAVQMALGVKRDYLNPQDFGSQEAALDRLAASLAMLPDFSLQEIAIAAGHAPTRRTAPAPTIVTAPKGSRNRGFRVALIVLALMLGLEALARAGVGVVSPIAVIVDRLGGGSGSEKAPGDLNSLVDPEAAASQSHPGAPSLPIARRSAARWDGNEKPKNERHARGRELHQAQGREQHQAQGRELHQPDRLRNPRPASAGAERVVRRSYGKARAAVTSRVERNRGSRGWRRSK